MTNSPADTLLSTAAFNVGLVLVTLVVFWGAVFVMRRFGFATGYSLSALGISRPKEGILTGAGFGFLIGVIALTVSIPLNLLSAVVLERFGYSAESTVQQPFMRGLQSWVAESPAVAVPAMIGVVVLLGPAVEELVFRGGIYNGLRQAGNAISRSFGSKEAESYLRWFWFGLAALSSSVFFALLHLEPTLLPALVVLAVALCWLFERTGSLLPPIVAHATFNSFATFVIILSGLGVFPSVP